MQRHLVWLAVLLLIAASANGWADEPAKEKTKGTTIVPEPVSLRQGGGLSIRTPVARPRSVKGARSWTIETSRHRWAAIDIALSGDGALLATSGYDGMIRLWDTTTGRLVRVLVGHDSYVYGMAFSADGRYLASAGSFDVTVRVWETETGLPVRVMKGLKEAPTVVAWSPDGSLLAAGTIESGYVSVWRAATGKLVKTVSSGKTIRSLAFSPDGQLLACGVYQVGVVLRSSPGWGVDAQIDLTGQDSRSLAFSKDGKQLVAAGTKQAVAWDVYGKKLAKRFDWSADLLARHGNRVAVCSPAGKTYDLVTGKPGVAIPTGGAVCWSQDGKAIYVLSGDHVLHVDPAKGMEVKRWSVAETGTIWWYPGRPMVTGIGSLTPRLWDQTTGKLLHTLEGHTAGTAALAWSPGGKILATGGYDKTVRVWNPSTGKLVRTLVGPEAAVTALAVSGDGKIAAGAADKKVYVFAKEGTKPVKVYSGHTDAVRALAWGRDGRLASGGLDAVVRIWGTEPTKPLHSLENAGSVVSLAFSPNGKWLAAGASEQRVWVWTYPGRKLVHEFTSGGDPPAVSALAWSPDSSQLLAGRANHTLQLWDLKSDKPRQSIGVMAPVQSVSWAAGGKTMATCTIDRCVRFWSSANGQLLTTVVMDKDQVGAIHAEGYHRVANEKETELVCVVLTAKGMDTLTLSRFAKDYVWKNNSARARMTGN
jgi:WD40 repeat protein